MGTRVLLLLGTRKGAFILDGDPARSDWQLRGPLAEGWPIHDIALDPDIDDDGPDGGLPTNGPAVTVDVVRGPEPGRVTEWVRRVRELWVQTTFYVFDANSWRT